MNITIKVVGTTETDIIFEVTTALGQTRSQEISWLALQEAGGDHLIYANMLELAEQFVFAS